MIILRGRVANVTRTRDHRDHNPGLYQLSYRHRGGDRIARAVGHTGRARTAPGPVAQWIERQASNLRAEVQFLPGPLRPKCAALGVPWIGLGSWAFDLSQAFSRTRARRRLRR